MPNLLLLLNLLLAALKDFGVDVPASIDALITDLEPVALQLVGEITDGGSPSEEVVSVLQTLLPAIEAIKQDTSLDAQYTEWAGLLTETLANVAVADADAQTDIDPSKLHDE